MSFDEVATIEKGVVIKQSSICGAGNGLFTGRPFLRNDLITEYCGPIIDHQKALKLRKRGRATHVRVLNSQWLYIDGLKKAVPGAGGASFANDARKASAYNAVFVQRFDRKLGRDRVFLKASRDLGADEEVFVSYGNTYWQTSKQLPQLPDRQLLSPADVVALQEQQQQQQQQAEQQLRRSPRQRRQRQANQQQAGISCALQQEFAKQREEYQQQGMAAKHSSATNSIQQALSAPVEQHRRVTLPSKRMVLHEMQLAEEELQRASKRQAQQQQQQQQQPVQQGPPQQQQVQVQDGSQDSTSTQVGWRRSARVRCRQDKQQQQLEQQQQAEEASAGSGRSCADAAGVVAGVEEGTSLHGASMRKQRAGCTAPGAHTGREKHGSNGTARSVQMAAAAAGAQDAGAGTAAALRQAAMLSKFTVKALARTTMNTAAAVLTWRGRS